MRTPFTKLCKFFHIPLLRAFILPTVLVISILICLLILFAIALFDINNLYVSNYRLKRQQKEDINSAFVLYCNDSTLLSRIEKNGFYRLYEDKPQTAFQIKTKQWGLYECVEVHAPDNSFSSIRLLGKAQESVYEAALWVCSRDMSLSFGGNSEVKGKAYIPANGINYTELENLSFRGKEIEDYYIDLSEKELPEVDLPNLHLMEKYLKETEIIPSLSDHRYKRYYSFSEDEVHFHVPDTVVQVPIRGHVVLHGDDIVISSETSLSDVILIARHVTIGEGFRGSLQVIATDTVILGKNSRLEYPSGVYLKGNSDRTHLRMEENSTLNGYAIVFGTTGNNTGVYVEENFRQDSTAIFNGLLYVDGVAHLQGECYGGAYLKECYYLPYNGAYAGTIYNARIYRNSTIGFPFFFKQSPYYRREIKTLAL